MPSLIVFVEENQVILELDMNATILDLATRVEANGVNLASPMVISEDGRDITGGNLSEQVNWGATYRFGK